MTKQPRLQDFLEATFDQAEHVFTCHGRSCSQGRAARPRDGVGALAGFRDPDGVFIGINPSDATGTYSKENVTAIRNIVFESDTMPVGEQLRAVKALDIPYSAVVFSGSKSAHFWICLDQAIDQATFSCYTHRLLLFLEENGFKADQQLTNENRLMRFPGGFRGDREQKLLQVLGRISESSFCFDFINARCPPWTPPVAKAWGTIEKADVLMSTEEAEKYCTDRWPLLAGSKQGNLFAWAKFLVGNTALNREEIVAIIARNDGGRHCITSEYERAVDRCISMLQGQTGCDF